MSANESLKEYDELKRKYMNKSDNKWKINRPRYETEFDISNEQKVSEVMASEWNCQLHKLPISYRLDFLLTRGGMAKAVVEVKARNNAHNKYSTLLLSLSKWNHGIEFKTHNNLEFILVAKFTDGIYYYVYSDEDEFEIKWGGRTVNKRDSADIEPVVHIPIEKMIRI